jgi:hypothetical protein
LNPHVQGLIFRQKMGANWLQILIPVKPRHSFPLSFTPLAEAPITGLPKPLTFYYNIAD